MTVDEILKALPGLDKTWLDKFVSDVGEDYATLLYRELRFIEKTIDSASPPVKQVFFSSNGVQYPTYFSYMLLNDLHGSPVKEKSAPTKDLALEFDLKPVKDPKISTIPVKFNPSLTKENPIKAEKHPISNKSITATQIKDAPRSIALLPSETSTILTTPISKTVEQSKIKPISNTFVSSMVTPNRVSVSSAAVKVQANPLPHKVASTISEKSKKADKPVVYSTKTTETIIVKGKK